MKLRNKKTGEIVDVESLGHAESLKEKYGYQVTLSWKTKYENLLQCKSYESLAELNEDWEDYKPKEPLIKDEEIRKAVRAWAEANDFMKLEFVKWTDNHWILRAKTEDGHEFDIDFFDNKCKNLPKYEDETFYTIAELCGEEEK